MQPSNIFVQSVIQPQSNIQAPMAPNDIPAHCSKIGSYHYNMFCSSYGSPKFLLQYKVEFIWLFVYMIFFTLSFSFDPLPAFNKAVDNLTEDRRVAYSIYWAPSILYASLSVLALSDYLCSQKRMAAIISGSFTLFWHYLYFIVFWSAPSVKLPSTLEDMSPSAGWYWTELFINQILVIIQTMAFCVTRNYVSYQEQKFDSVKGDVQNHFNMKKLTTKDYLKRKEQDDEEKQPIHHEEQEEQHNPVEQNQEQEQAPNFQANEQGQ